MKDHNDLSQFQAEIVAEKIIEEAYPNIHNRGQGWWGAQRIPNYGILRGAIVSHIKQIESEADHLRAKNQRQRAALEVARKHISGKAGKFSERERTPVLFQINEALEEESSDAE